MKPPFSARCPNPAEHNAWSRAARDAGHSGSALLDLTLSNPTRALLDRPLDPMCSAFMKSVRGAYSPHPQGDENAREAISTYHRDTHGVRVAPRFVQLVAGTSQGYSFLFKLLTEPGDAVLVPSPGYPLFEHLLRLEGLRAISYPLSVDTHWQIDFESLRARLQPRTKAMIVVNPGNPTGTYLDRSSWDAISTFCRSHALTLISDEVFADYPLSTGNPAEGGYIPAARGLSDAVPAFTLSGLSKVLGLPQLKLSWILIHGSPEHREEARRRLEFIADLYLGISAPVERALARLMDARALFQAPIHSRVRSNNDALESMIDRTAGLSLLPADAGWARIIRLPRVASEEALVLDLLKHARLLFHPGHFFDFDREAFIVTSLLIPPDHLRDGIGRLNHRARLWMKGVRAG